MKVYQPTMPVALSKLKAGDLYYTIDGDKSVLAMRVEEEASDHPYFVRLQGEKPFQLEDGERRLDTIVQPATDLECRIVGSGITVTHPLQDLIPGSLVFGNGLSGIIIRNHQQKSAYNLVTGKGLAGASILPCACYGSWKLVRKVDKPEKPVDDYHLEDVFTFPKSS